MQLRFKTKSLSVARKAALVLIRVRSESYEPLMANEVAEWVECRFPALTAEDQQKLATECSFAIMEMIDG